MQRAEERLVWIVPLTLVIILLLLFLNFRNFIQALMVLAAVPLSPVGGFWLVSLQGKGQDSWLSRNLSVSTNVPGKRQRLLSGLKLALE